MSFNIARLTLQAVLSSIEEDLRAAIVTFLGSQIDTATLLGPSLSQKLRERMKGDQNSVERDSSLDALLLLVDFGDLYMLLNTHSKSLPEHIAKHYKSVTPKLALLVPIRNRVAHTRPLRPTDLAETMTLVEELTRQQSAVWSHLHRTLQRLQVEPSFVIGLNIPFYDDERITHNLPIPEFDETGFVGREKLVELLINKCTKGSYPVVTILGDGGVGKTAIALKVAYDILDLPDCPYEAIIWATSKTLQLTGQEIVKINGAISDSFGIFNSVARELAGNVPGDFDPIEELLAYMTDFKILLVLDNLETVVDDNIRGFLGRLPRGCLVLITSRIGLGQFEDRVLLQPMESGEAIQLLRTSAQVRAIPNLTKLANAVLESYCHRMKNNPGWIKWFVAAVQTGTRPEEVLEKPDVFLDFCMSNVYHYLSDYSKQILSCLLCVPGKRNQAELVFLTAFEPLELQLAIQQLMTTNFLQVTQIPRGVTFETFYELTELTRAYLRKHHNPNNQVRDEFVKKGNQLRALDDRYSGGQLQSPFDINTVAIRTKSDRVTAHTLINALQANKREDYEAAETYADNARRLSPDYYEVHRVRAVIYASQNDYSRAQDEYEAAIELMPKSAPLRYFYGGFLLRCLNESEEAARQLEIAAIHAPDALEIQLELARARLYLHDFEAVEVTLTRLIDKNVAALHLQRKIWDLRLQLHQRQAGHFLDNERDEYAALKQLTKLVEVYNLCPQAIRDRHMISKIRKALPTVQTCAYKLRDSDLSGYAQDLVTTMQDLIY